MSLQPIFRSLEKNFWSPGNIDDRIIVGKRANNSGDWLDKRIFGDENRIEKSIPVFRLALEEVFAMVAISERAIEIHEHAIGRIFRTKRIIQRSGGQNTVADW